MQVLQQRQGLLQHVKFVPFRAFGSHFPFYGEGDAVLHLPGLSTDTRISIFKEFLDGADFENGKLPPTLSAPYKPVENHDHKPAQEMEQGYAYLNKHARSGRYGACSLPSQTKNPQYIFSGLLLDSVVRYVAKDSIVGYILTETYTEPGTICIPPALSFNSTTARSLVCGATALS